MPAFKSPYLGDFPVDDTCAEANCSRPAKRLLVLVEDGDDDEGVEVTVAYFCDPCADLRHVEWKKPDA